MLLAHEQGATGVVVVNNRVSVGSVVKMNLGELTHRLDFNKMIGQSLKFLRTRQISGINRDPVSRSEFQQVQLN